MPPDKGTGPSAPTPEPAGDRLSAREYTGRPGSAESLLAGLLPPWWRDRAALLDAARAVDATRSDGLRAVLLAWGRFRAVGVLPPAGPLRDVVAALVTVLGGVGPELRYRPRRRA